jgi:transcriptional regulator with GAF, ATPase, and Fis domain
LLSALVIPAEAGIQAYEVKTGSWIGVRDDGEKPGMTEQSIFTANKMQKTSQQSHKPMSPIKKKISIRTRHLVPFILAAFNGLSMLIVYIYLCAGNPGIPATKPVLLIISLSMVSLAGAYLMIRWIISPMEKFVETARRNPAIPADLFEDKNGSASSDVEHYQRILQNITDFLDKKEARTLFPEILGQSRIMLGLMSRILKVASSDSTVLITGESGTGKELIASALVSHSTRAGKPFVKVNCAAIPEGLLESELFGHEKGAFTGAVSSRAGKFELADKGTMLLDEIGDMPLPVQAKLLRFLQEKEFQRLGGSRTVKVDLRIMAATNKDLEDLVAKGEFREDLYYRINVFRLDVPPLRVRKEDIPILAEFFSETGPKPKKIGHDAMEALRDYSWPGNVRELRNTIERACITSRDDTIHARDLEIAPGEHGGSVELAGPVEQERVVDDLDRWLADAEKDIIISALKRCNGVQAKAAELLNIKQRSLWHRVKKYEINPKEYK